MGSMRWLGLFLVGCVACGTEEVSPDETAETGEAPSASVGRCDYTNNFSQGAECREYVGAGWTEETAAAQCAQASIAASAGTFTAGAACPTDDILGVCRIDAGTPDELILVFPGTDPAACTGVSVGCGFGGGTFEPAAPCAGDDLPSGSELPVFRPFEQVCEVPAGRADEVCTWQAISACTEPGLVYQEMASCDPVFTQRPYAPYEIEVPFDAADPRLSDATYQAELAWVTSEVEACACTCCHSGAAPEGPSGWYLESGPLWIDGLDDDGLAMLAGWVDSTAFGAFDPADNNGFDRSTTGLPTSDVPRMVAFLEGELARRGLTRADFADAEPFGGVLYDQLVYEPTPCGAGQGMEGGELVWSGGDARYLYVLAAGSMSPGVPPNLDTPDGTIWRVDVAPDDAPISSGVAYGVAPAGARTAFPASGAPAALVSGQTYYLVALRDIYQPLTRCLFVAE